MGTSVLHIKTEVECRVYLFDEEKGIAKPGTYFNLEVRKGEQDLLFVSTEDEAVICFKSYNVGEGDCDYRMTLEQSQFINVNAEATEKEIASGIKDEFGVAYSHDGLQLLKDQNVTIKEYHIRDGCKVIRGRAFLWRNLSDIILPDSLTHIGKNAFENCSNLTAITLPAGLAYIGDCAFLRCRNLTVITMNVGLAHIGNGAFCWCENLTAITLPACLTYIGNSAFLSCKKLIAITLPANLTHIGDSAFYCCENLTSITLSDKLTHIGDWAFYHCEKLTSITLPDSLTRIGDGAFSGCKRLTAINIPASLMHFGDGVFSGTGIHNVVSNSPNFIFSDGCLIDQQNHMLLKYMSDKDIISLPAGLTHIGGHAFSDCNNLAAITLPAGLTHIENCALLSCKNLTAITLPAGLAYIGDYNFSCCNNLTTITLPASLTHIGYRAFELCENLTSITLPAGLTHIGYGAFGECNSLSHIFIPEGMRTHFEALLPEELHEKLIEMDNNKSVEILVNLPYYIFFDTETTGVPRDYNALASNTRNWPRLVQLGWIVTDEEGNVLSQGNEIVKPEGFVIPADAARVHGITTERAQREGKPLREVIDAFLKDAEQTKCIVGHNISFDQKVVGAELYRFTCILLCLGVYFS